MTDFPPDTILSCTRLSKHFGSIRALREADFFARRGEITAVVGDNGAGKSTLIRCLVGLHRPDSGSRTFDGAPCAFATPDEARRAGIETVHQNLALVDELTVMQNLFLNREIVRRIGPLVLLDRSSMRREAVALLSRLSINVPSVQSRVRRLSGGQRQAIAICRAVGAGAKLVVMDEPTAALGVQETANVESLIVRLRREGVSIILISHNFDQVMRLADQIWIMRAGEVVATRRSADTDGNELVALITGASRAQPDARIHRGTQA
jgi:D-xylose transport system ATP-binding protein